MIAPHTLVLVAPPGTAADLNTIWKRGSVSAFFTHDPGLDWLDDDGCRKATGFLAAGVQVCLQFDKLADAMSCKSRLLREMAQ